MISLSAWATISHLSKALGSTAIDDSACDVFESKSHYCNSTNSLIIAEFASIWPLSFQEGGFRMRQQDKLQDVRLVPARLSDGVYCIYHSCTQHWYKWVHMSMPLVLRTELLLNHSLRKVFE
jgi:hypothetical protein